LTNAYTVYYSLARVVVMNHCLLRSQSVNLSTVYLNLVYSTYIAYWPIVT